MQLNELHFVMSCNFIANLFRHIFLLCLMCIIRIVGNFWCLSVFTINNLENVIIKYHVILLQISDQKLICNWLAKTDQKLTCSAVELESDAKFSAVINSQVSNVNC